MSDVVLKTMDLTREYRVGRSIVTALGGVNITLHRNEFVAIMGPSGCGKSTLVNLLGGLDRPTGGKVLLDGHDLAFYSEEQLAEMRRSRLGFIFQHHDLFSVLTARENVEFPLMLRGVASDLRRSKAEALLDQLGLASEADRLPDELSGGQQQRVGIARALVNNPVILLADEPTGNLDSETAAGVVESLVQQKNEQGITLLMVTHDPETAAKADRTVYLKDGLLVNEQGGMK